LLSGTELSGFLIVAVPEEDKEHPSILYSLDFKTLEIVSQKKLNKIVKPFICIKKNRSEILVVGIKAASVYHYFESGFLEASRIDFFNFQIS
jgi:hypothetical protein